LHQARTDKYGEYREHSSAFVGSSVGMLGLLSGKIKHPHRLD